MVMALVMVVVLVMMVALVMVVALVVVVEALVAVVEQPSQNLALVLVVASAWCADMAVVALG